MSTRKTTDRFIAQARAIHGDRYDYSLVEYQTQGKHVVIRCRVHGEFLQKPKLHLLGKNCRRCADEGRRGDLGRFIKRATLRHGTFYDYSKIELFTGWTNEIVIGCPLHGDFVVKRAKSHLVRGKSARTCPQCASHHEKTRDRRRHNFISKAEELHGQRYDYTAVMWKNYKTPVEITCWQHGTFMQSPSNHVTVSGCPICSAASLPRKRSRGELEITAWLLREQIPFQKEKSFSDLKNPSTGYRLRYDFFIPSWNCLLEYDGLFHFQQTVWNDLTETRKRDHLKNDYAWRNGFVLVRLRKLNDIQKNLYRLRNNLERPF